MNESPLSTAQERLLRYWSANMGIARELGGKSWPGFNYAADERARMDEISKPLDGSSLWAFFGVTVVSFLVFAGGAVVAILLPALTLLYPDPSKLEVLPFLLLMGSVIAVCYGIGLPLTIMAGGWAGDRWGNGTPSEPRPGDAALYRKIRWQFLRMALITVGLFIPLTLAFILFRVDAGPLAIWLKTAFIALSALSLGGVLLGNRR